ncbi:MAG: hypothetical protein ACO3UU_16675, partial [Minisyncoccia bacterium]
ENLLQNHLRNFLQKKMMTSIFNWLGKFFDPRLSYVEYMLKDVKDFAELEYKMKCLRNRGYL